MYVCMHYIYIYIIYIYIYIYIYISASYIYIYIYIQRKWETETETETEGDSKRMSEWEIGRKNDTVVLGKYNFPLHAYIFCLHPLNGSMKTWLNRSTITLLRTQKVFTVGIFFFTYTMVLIRRRLWIQKI